MEKWMEADKYQIAIIIAEEIYLPAMINYQI